MRFTVRFLRTLIREAIADGWTDETLRQRRGFSHKVARLLMASHPKKMKQLGLSENEVDNLPIMGQGTKGVAFDLGDRVLKFTDDVEEARSAAQLKGVSNPVFPKYYDVFVFGQAPNFFGIVLEKLVPMSKSEADSLDDLLTKTNFHRFIAAGNYDPNEMTELYKKKVNQLAREKNFDERQRRTVVQQYYDMWMMIMKDFGIYKIMKSLQDVGIQFFDYHAGNIMKRASTGEFVVIDLGYSSGAKAKIEVVKE